MDLPSQYSDSEGQDSQMSDIDHCVPDINDPPPQEWLQDTLFNYQDFVNQNSTFSLQQASAFLQYSGDSSQSTTVNHAPSLSSNTFQYRNVTPNGFSSLPYNDFEGQNIVQSQQPNNQNTLPIQQFNQTVSHMLHYAVDSGKTKHAQQQNRDIEKVVTDATRLYLCTQSGCRVGPLKDPAGLTRHLREVHGLRKDGTIAETFPCPEPTCQRHKRGFRRKSNMKDHYKRTHLTDSSSSPMSLPTPATSHASEVVEEEDEIRLSSVVGLRKSPILCRSDRQVANRQQAILDNLEQRCLKLEAQIKALQHCIETFQGSCEDLEEMLNHLQRKKDNTDKQIEAGRRFIEVCDDE